MKYLRVATLIALLLIVFNTSGYSQVNPSNITIARDTFGVPHIFSKTDAEAAYGLAWAHAEDDFENIQYNLLAAKAMLGRVQGLDGVLFDFALQFLSIDSLVEARYEKDLSPEFRAIMEAYAAGINAYAEAHKKERIRKKAFPFTGMDVVKGYVLNTSLMAGVGMALKAINENRVEEFMNANDVGSNAVAVAPSHMDDGKGYLLINSHQPIEGRFAWWEAHINSEEGWNIMGGLFPGGASIFVGTNTKLGWAHTFNYHNFGDVYKLEINPEDKYQYKYDGKWHDFYVKKVKLKVKIAGIPLPVKRKVLVCEYGPVFKTKHGYYAVRFPAYTDIRAGEQWFKMNKAQSLEEFEEAISMQAVPLFNIVYADVDGNIMLHSGGKMPNRDATLDWTYPITANTSAYKWNSILPYSRMPQVKNPSCGYVFNANNTPLVSTGGLCNWKGDFVGLQRFMYNRGDQFDHLLKGRKDGFTEAYLNEVKFNTAYAPNGEYMKHMKALFKLDEKKYPDIADAITKMKQWDLSGNADNPNAALAMVTHDFLRQKINGPFAWLMIRDSLLSEEDAAWALRSAKKLLVKGHGSIDVPLGEVQRLIRGDKSLPANGLREVPRATDTKLYKKKKAIFRVTGGDGYIQVVRYPKAGLPAVKSINAYGASADPKSPHYNDQMEMFTNHEYRSMTWDKEEILNSAERVYSPK